MTIDSNGCLTSVSEIYQVKTFADKLSTKVFCRWSIPHSLSDKQELHQFHTVHLQLSVLGPSAHYHGSAKGLQVCDATGTALETLFHGIPDLKSRTEVAVKVILVPYNGYMCSSDILELRMRHCEAVHTVVSFATWEHYLPACSVHEEINLLELLQSSPGAIVAKKIHSSHDEALDLLQMDLELRLSFDWILPTKPAARCVAVVAGRPMCEPKRFIYWSQGYFMAARVLGISMIVFDEPGHWLEGEEYAHPHSYYRLYLP